MILYGIDNIRDLFGHKVRPSACPRLRPVFASWLGPIACGTLFACQVTHQAISWHYDWESRRLVVLSSISPLAVPAGVGLCRSLEGNHLSTVDVRLQVSLNMVRRNPICRLGYRSGKLGTLGAEGEPHAPA